MSKAISHYSLFGYLLNAGALDARHSFKFLMLPILLLLCWGCSDEDLEQSHLHIEKTVREIETDYADSYKQSALQQWIYQHTFLDTAATGAFAIRRKAGLDFAYALSHLLDNNWIDSIRQQDIQLSFLQRTVINQAITLQSANGGNSNYDDIRSCISLENDLLRDVLQLQISIGKYSYNLEEADSLIRNHGQLRITQLVKNKLAETEQALLPKFQQLIKQRNILARKIGYANYLELRYALQNIDDDDVMLYEQAWKEIQLILEGATEYHALKNRPVPKRKSKEVSPPLFPRGNSFLDSLLQKSSPHQYLVEGFASIKQIGFADMVDGRIIEGSFFPSNLPAHLRYWQGAYSIDKSQDVRILGNSSDSPLEAWKNGFGFALQTTAWLEMDNEEISPLLRDFSVSYISEGMQQWGRIIGNQEIPTMISDTLWNDTLLILEEGLSFAQRAHHAHLAFALEQELYTSIERRATIDSVFKDVFSKNASDILLDKNETSIFKLLPLLIERPCTSQNQLLGAVMAFSLHAQCKGTPQPKCLVALVSRFSYSGKLYPTDELLFDANLTISPEHITNYFKPMLVFLRNR